MRGIEVAMMNQQMNKNIVIARLETEVESQERLKVEQQESFNRQETAIVNLQNQVISLGGGVEHLSIQLNIQHQEKEKMVEKVKPPNFVLVQPKESKKETQNTPLIIL
jgi:hypothetical protein